ncbi:DUF6268 family outer membrane beta-barrel protein [Chryseobacterium sp. JK1]|uniref:DUF6268 family outer membrane beta-barrel protein n=1 Tax=Chryseobacterium sp. JK1 TaxID=874294 RepID=UPI003D6828A1
MKKVLLIAVFSCLLASVSAQIQIRTEYLSSSSLQNKEDEKFGKGDMLKISGRYTLPLSIIPTERAQPRIWNATISGSYGSFRNELEQADLDQSQIINANFTVNHIRPISEKWSFIGSLGAGIYSSPKAITAESILFNGAAIFMYRIKDNLSIGAGAGLTNSFGVPLLIPMALVNWKVSGDYEVSANIASGIDISAAAKLSEHWKLRITGIEIDGISSVVKIDDTSKIYGLSNIRSYISPEYKRGNTSLFIGLGGNWMRSVTLADRSFKGFTESLFKNKNKFNFGSSFYITVGFRYSMF